MKVRLLALDGLKVLSPQIYPDERGFFLETFRAPLYAQEGISPSFVQDNLVFSKKHVIRGLHFQNHPGQAKLVSCLEGVIWDVAVDLRLHSKTFGQWESVLLDSHLREQFFIPVGFAHGYCVLSESALVSYKVSSIYDPLEEKSLRWNDPDLKIQWPIDTPFLSERDQKSPYFKELFNESKMRSFESY
jgi:dTDP-4-dehydrorhamnose 3,5-epimerase